MLTLNDGRSELWQWDTGRTLSVDADCSQVHFSNKIIGRSIDVDVIDGVAIIPDILLQTDKYLNVWAFVGAAENGYTKISKIFKVNRRNKPADYVFTPQEQVLLKDAIAIVETAKSAANDAIESAKQAQASADKAAQAKKDALTAQSKAETAKSGAETGANNASNSAAEALTAKNEAESAKNAAAGSANAAQNSKNAAAQSAEAANTAKTAAQEAAGAAQQYAENAAQSAAAAAESAGTLSGAIADIAQLKSDIVQKADKTALAKTDRSLDALWKLNQGITYEFQTDDAEAYSKTVPSGAKLADVNSVGGKTVVWNQAIGLNKVIAYYASNTSPVMENDEFLYVVKTLSSSARIESKPAYFTIVESNIYYVLKRIISPHKTRTSNDGLSNEGTCYIQANTPTSIRYIKKATSAEAANPFRCYLRTNGTEDPFEVGDVIRVKLKVFNLTQLFGAGNEPTSTDDPRIAWIEQYATEHPEYNAGELVSVDVESVKYNDTIITDIPAAVQELPGYGWSAGAVYNGIERTETGWQYVQRVGSREYQDGDTVTDGTITYYELGAPIITDITELMENALDAITVEAGGALIFENAAQLPVPNSVEYAVKLSEVIQS